MVSVRARDFIAFLFLFQFNETIIPDYSQLGAPRLVDYLPSHIQRALVE